MDGNLIEIRHLKKYFQTPKGLLHAVDDISLNIKKGTTLGVVGESGCGKSTLGRTILRLVEATSGQVIYNGRNVLEASAADMKKLRRKLQMIFQDPYASLNPRMSVSQLIKEPLIVNGTATEKRNINQRVEELMETVGLAPRLINAYPHELDGGRRQRIGIARALSLQPDFIVCDEPVSALDVSIQAQILNLMSDLQKEIGLTYMFITHDLSVVRHISDEIAVMYLGQCVERVKSEELFARPLHPYTQALLKAIPIADLSMRNRKREIIKGELTSPIDPKPGCRFAPRCPYTKPECYGENIALKEVEPDRFVACVLYQ
jgi:peptide/nickel transport system ATP-binding protein